MRAGQHGMDETFVPRNIDEADGAPIGLLPVGEAKVDGDTARFLLLEAVGIGAGQRAYQRGLTVIDVAGRADDHRDLE